MSPSTPPPLKFGCQRPRTRFQLSSYIPGTSAHKNGPGFGYRLEHLSMPRGLYSIVMPVSPSCHATSSPFHSYCKSRCRLANGVSQPLRCGHNAVTLFVIRWCHRQLRHCFPIGESQRASFSPAIGSESPLPSEQDQGDATCEIVSRRRWHMLAWPGFLRGAHPIPARGLRLYLNKALAD